MARNYKSSGEMYNQALFEKYYTPELKLCLWPRECYLTGKKLWLKKAYFQQRAEWIALGNFRGHTGFRLESRWYDKDAFLVERLKGNV